MVSTTTPSIGQTRSYESCSTCSSLWDLLRCQIRGLTIDDPFWTYCGNQTRHNPLQIRIPVGPVYTTREYPYRRVLLHPSPQEPNLRSELLALIRRLKNGELDRNSRTFQVALIQHLGDLEMEDAVSDLVDLACASLGSNDLIGPDHHPETVAVRVEFRRLAALKALRHIAGGISVESIEGYRSTERELDRHRESGQPEYVARADFTWAFVGDYKDA